MAFLELHRVTYVAASGVQIDVELSPARFENALVEDHLTTVVTPACPRREKVTGRLNSMPSRRYCQVWRENSTFHIPSERWVVVVGLVWVVQECVRLVVVC